MADYPVYLDNHATTRVDPRVVDAMVPYFSTHYGNAASINHAFGWEAERAVTAAREQLASVLGVAAKTLIFTSGATESNNIAIKGVLDAAPPGGHLITNAAEHRAVLDPAKRLQRAGVNVTILPVDEFGRVDPQQVADAIRPETALVSVMAANNEVGTLNPIVEIGTMCQERDVLFHCDAVQAIGRIAFPVGELPIDLLSMSAHKINGPKGIGTLYVRRRSPRIRIQPLFDGGGHENHLRSGTLPVPLIVGFGECCRLAAECRDDEGARIVGLRERLWQGLCDRLDGLHLNGHPDDRLPGNLNLSFEGVDGDALMTGLKRIAVSSGSACTSALPEPSHVLRAMGISDALTRASLRFGIGRFNTDDDIEVAIKEVATMVKRLRGS